MSINPQIAVSGQVVYVIWEDDDEFQTGGIPDILFRRSFDRGAHWDPPLDQLPINLSTFPSRGISVVHSTLAAAGDELYVAWRDDTANDTTNGETPQIFFRRFLGAGVDGTIFDWDPPLNKDSKQLTCPKAANPFGCRGLWPSLAAAGSNVYLAWELDQTGTTLSA